MNAPLHATFNLPRGLAWGVRRTADKGLRQTAHVYRTELVDGDGVVSEGLFIPCCSYGDADEIQLAFTQPGRLCRICERRLERDQIRPART